MARLHAEEIKISWSVRKRCFKIILVERLWRTHKYEVVRLHAYSDVWEADISLVRFMSRHYQVKPQRFMRGKTPHELYIETEPFPSRPELTISGAIADESQPTASDQLDAAFVLPLYYIHIIYSLDIGRPNPHHSKAVGDISTWKVLPIFE